ncbi:MAG: tRNA (guanosine(46)-N7)-methyltransferase TrmB [Pseudomonadota bacterium]
MNSVNRIRSFVRRQGRITPSQCRAFETYGEHYILNSQDGKLDVGDVFGRQADCIVEIGFGMGDTLLSQARQQRDKNFIGIEVYRPGVGALLANMVKQDVGNIRIYNEDAVEVLEHCIDDACLAAVHIYFPDPWPKKRHQKRRLIQTEFLSLLQKKLKIGGVLHLATDWEHYAEQMLTTLNATPGFKNGMADGGFSPRPETRPLTKFERRGIKLGHSVWDLLFIKS